MTHPTSDIDDAVHQRVRLGTLAILDEVSEAEFGFIKDSLGVTAGNLSRHLDVLGSSGLIMVRKGHIGKRPRTWISITPRGHDAFTREIAALRAMIASIDEGKVARPGVPVRGAAPFLIRSGEGAAR